MITVNMNDDDIKEQLVNLVTNDAIKNEIINNNTFNITMKEMFDVIDSKDPLTTLKTILNGK